MKKAFPLFTILIFVSLVGLASGKSDTSAIKIKKQPEEVKKKDDKPFKETMMTMLLKFEK